MPDQGVRQERHCYWDAVGIYERWISHKAYCSIKERMDVLIDRSGIFGLYAIGALSFLLGSEMIPVSDWGAVAVFSLYCYLRTFQQFLFLKGSQRT
jgi:hypothetical protein